MGVFLKGKTWYIDYYVEGRRRREAIGPDKRLAQAVLAKRKVEIAENRYLDKREVPRTLFREMAREFLQWAKANKRSWSRDADSLRHLERAFGSRLLAEITTADIETYKSDRLGHVRPATVNRELSCLKTLFRKAIAWDRTDRDPARSVQKLRENNTRLRYLSPEEETRLLAECSPHLQPMVTLGLHTGMRCGEVLKLQWSEVDLENRLLLLADTKSGNRRELPLNRTAATTLARQPRHIRSPYVFCWPSGRRYKSVAIGFRNAARRAGLEDVVFHTLRHTFASRLVMAGADLVTVKELLGHSSLAMVLRYAHLSPRHRKRAVELLDRQPPETAAAVAVSGERSDSRHEPQD